MKKILDATNMKTGKGGFVIGQYVDRRGVSIVKVDTGLRKAYWRADHVKIVEVMV